MTDRPPAWLLAVCAAIGPMAVTIALPANTQIMREFNTEYGIAQLMLTSFLASMGIALLLIGFLADRFGRRPVMICGMLVFTVGCAVVAFSDSLELLLIGRAVQGFGAATGQALARAIVRDLFGRDKAASMIGYITMATLVAPMLGPAIGGALTEWMSWRYIFMLLGILSMMTTALIWRKMPETGALSMQMRPRLMRSAIQLLSDSSFRIYTFVLIFGTGIYWAFQAGAPFLVLEVMQRPPSEYGLYFFFTAVGYGSGNFLSGRFSVRAGTDRMMLIALIPLAIGLGLIWLFTGANHPLALFGPMFLLTMSNGMTIPNATAGALSARPELAGTAAGLAGFLQVGIGAGLTVLVGFIQNGLFWPLLAVMTTCGLLTAVAVARRWRNRHNAS